MKAMPDKSPFTKFLRTYQESDIIFEGNSLGSEMYVIHSGKVRLTTKKMGRDVILATLGPGEFFGEMALVDSFPRTATPSMPTGSRRRVIFKGQRNSSPRPSTSSENVVQTAG
jgi:CRP/FNR family transcriptional regulator, cyclic AMP receptor protein